LERSIRDELRRSAEDAAALARGMAPVRTGELRESVRVIEDPDHLTVLVIAADGPAFYGRFVEKGTRRLVRRPFLEPAVIAVRPAFRERMAAILRRA
jgi:HK97 gp10 family phage protein